MSDYCDVNAWNRLRRKFLSRLEGDISRGLIDPDILDVVAALNTIECLVSASSCSGRIGLFAAPLPGDKKHGGLVARWHRRIALGELLEALRMVGSERFVWLSVQPLILTLYACGWSTVEKVVAAFENVGFKYVCVKPTKYRGVYYVTIMGTERIDIPVHYGGKKLLEEKINDIVGVLNAYITLTKSKLDRLRRAVSMVTARLANVCGIEERLVRRHCVKNNLQNC